MAEKISLILEGTSLDIQTKEAVESAYQKYQEELKGIERQAKELASSVNENLDQQTLMEVRDKIGQ